MTNIPLDAETLRLVHADIFRSAGLPPREGSITLDGQLCVSQPLAAPVEAQFGRPATLRGQGPPSAELTQRLTLLVQKAHEDAENAKYAQLMRAVAQRVKAELGDSPQYADFLTMMRDATTLDRDQHVLRMSNIFSGRPNLRKEVNNIFPAELRISDETLTALREVDRAKAEIKQLKTRLAGDRNSGSGTPSSPFSALPRTVLVHIAAQLAMPKDLGRLQVAVKEFWETPMQPDAPPEAQPALVSVADEVALRAIRASKYCSDPQLTVATTDGETITQVWSTIHGSKQLQHQSDRYLRCGDLFDRLWDSATPEDFSMRVPGNKITEDDWYQNPDIHGPGEYNYRHPPRAIYSEAEWNSPAYVSNAIAFHPSFRANAADGDWGSESGTKPPREGWDAPKAVVSRSQRGYFTVRELWETLVRCIEVNSSDDYGTDGVGVIPSRGFGGPWLEEITKMDPSSTRSVAEAGHAASVLYVDKWGADVESLRAQLAVFGEIEAVVCGNDPDLSDGLRKAIDRCKKEAEDDKKDSDPFDLTRYLRTEDSTRPLNCTVSS